MDHLTHTTLNTPSTALVDSLVQLLNEHHDKCNQQPLSCAALYEICASGSMSKVAFQDALEFFVNDRLLLRVRRDAYLPNIAHEKFLKFSKPMVKAKPSAASFDGEEKKRPKKRKTAPTGEVAKTRGRKTTHMPTSKTLAFHITSYKENHAIVFSSKM